MTNRELFDMSSKAFSLMNAQEQAITLTLFQVSREPVIAAWISSVARVAKASTLVTGKENG